MHKILVIIPFVVDLDVLCEHEKVLTAANSKRSHITVVSLAVGPSPADFDKPTFQHAVPEILDVVRERQKDFDGIMISCFEDPGLAEAREISNIPVVAPCETAMLFAASLGRSFFLISPDPNSEGLYRRIAASFGLAANFAAFETIEFDVGGENDADASVARFASIVSKARNETHADIAILACTAFAGYANAIRCKAGGWIIEPATAAIQHLESLIDLRGPKGDFVA